MQFEKNKNNSSGFSILEIAVVIVIIGFMSILFFFGSQVMQSQRVNGIVSEITYFTNAHYTFRDQFSYRPGDVASGDLSSNFSGYAAAVGDSTSCVPGSLANNQWDDVAEEDLIWLQMSQKEYIRQDINFDPCASITGRDFGVHRPESGSLNAAGWTYLNDVTVTHLAEDYIFLYVLRLGKKSEDSDTSFSAGQTTVRMASAIDAKIDSPNTPLVGRIFTSTECVDTASTGYKPEGDPSKCTVAYAEIGSEEN